MSKTPKDKNGGELGLRAKSGDGSGELDRAVYVGDDPHEPEDDLFMPRVGQRRESSIASIIRIDEERLLKSFLRSSADGDSEGG